ncbi:hypothetical protein FACS189426_21260 [Bacteroidia bacterium]|nr:hypothetical protein FACS189426_21260 [Bacteroidia bacterium]GHV70965.1 hypothetical protein FACS189420_4220 [Bacteroidia bacterium]
MRKMIVLWVTMVVSTFVFSVLAQQESKLEDFVSKSQYKNNWFISIGGNANLMNGEQDKEFYLSDRITYGGQITIGKWLPSNFGMRLQANGGVLRGFNYAWHIDPGYYTAKDGNHLPWPKGLYAAPSYNGSQLPDDALMAAFSDRTSKDFNFVYSKDAAKDQKKNAFAQEFNYMTTTVDLMYNLTDLFRGYTKEEGNTLEVIPFVGLGLITAFDNKYTTPDFYQFVAKVGFRLNYNITKKIGVYLEAQGNVTDPEFDGYKGTAMFDAVSNIGLGLQYSLNKNYPSSIAKLAWDEINELNKKVNENRSLIENHQDILERQQDLLDRLQNCCDEKPVVITTPPVKGWRPEYIRFTLDSHVIQQVERYKIDDAVEYLKATPESKILLIGYADKQTATPPYNLKLSQKRVEAVAAEFKRLGIESNRIIVEWKGDKEQPFSQNDWNRVVIMVERK